MSYGYRSGVGLFPFVSFGQKTSETNLNGVVTNYTYGDTLGNLTQVVQDPSNSATGYTGLNRTTSMTYDYAGHVLCDAANRLTSRTVGSTAGTVTNCTDDSCFAPYFIGSNTAKTWPKGGF